MVGNGKKRHVLLTLCVCVCACEGKRETFSTTGNVALNLRNCSALIWKHSGHLNGDCWCLHRYQLPGIAFWELTRWSWSFEPTTNKFLWKWHSPSHMMRPPANPPAEAVLSQLHATRLEPTWSPSPPALSGEGNKTWALVHLSRLQLFAAGWH